MYIGSIYPLFMDISLTNHLKYKAHICVSLIWLLAQCQQVKREARRRARTWKYNRQPIRITLLTRDDHMTKSHLKTTICSHFTRQKCEWVASEKQAQRAELQKDQQHKMQKSGWMWSQALLRWGDSTSPHRIFTLLILWHIVISCSPTSLINFHFWWMAEVVCERPDFFFFPRSSSPPEALSGSQWSILRVAVSQSTLHVRHVTVC